MSRVTFSLVPNWEETQKLLVGTTLFMGISGAAFVNQFWLPRGAAIVTLDCTGCFKGAVGKCTVRKFVAIF